LTIYGFTEFNFELRIFRIRLLGIDNQPRGNTIKNQPKMRTVPEIQYIFDSSNRSDEFLIIGRKVKNS